MARAGWSTIVFGLAYVVLVVGVFLALGGAAYAQENPSSATDQYKSKVENVSVKDPAEPTKPTDPTGVSGESAETLPFTGLSLLATALIGGALLVLGIALRRRERRRDG